MSRNSSSGGVNSIQLRLPSISSRESAVNFANSVFTREMVVSSSTITMAVPEPSKMARYIASDSRRAISVRLMSEMSTTMPRMPAALPPRMIGAALMITGKVLPSLRLAVYSTSGRISPFRIRMMFLWMRSWSSGMKMSRALIPLARSSWVYRSTSRPLRLLKVTRTATSVSKTICGSESASIRGSAARCPRSHAGSVSARKCRRNFR